MDDIAIISVYTDNIKAEIEDFVAENSIFTSECNFTIKKIQTYIRDSYDDEFKEFKENIKTYYTDKEKIIDDDVELSQKYDIDIYIEKESKVQLKYHINYDDFFINPKIILLASSVIDIDSFKPKELLSILYKELNKIKATNNIIVNLFDESMIKYLKAFIKYLYAGKFKNKVKIPLFDGIKPELVRDGKLVYNFLQKDTHNKIIEVKKDEILVTYYKPKLGRNGFNCYGQIVKSGVINEKEDLTQKINFDNIKTKENEIKKQYISKIKGFVYCTKTDISVERKIKMDNLSRVEDHVSSHEDNNIEVVISQHDTNEDSIGEGVELISESIHISGHVGANSIIEAKTLKIDGATHQDSTQFAKFADINRHKGTLRCNKANIKLLEGGSVHASSVDIETCLGGSIHAQDVKIGHVKSNLKVYASNSITIKLISGDNNQLKINYVEVPILLSKLALIKEDIEELKFSLEEAQRHSPATVSSIKDEIKTLKQEILDIQESVYNAKISIDKPIIGLNKIIFSINEENSITFQTDSRDYSPFYIKHEGDKVTLFPTLQTIKISS